MQLQNKNNNPVGLLRTLVANYRQEIFLAVIFSSIANLMMLVPTVYMLQVYDRVMVSKSEVSLIVISLIALGLMLSMVISELLRSKVLIFSGVDIEKKMGARLFRAIFLSRLNPNKAASLQPFNDLALVRQALTGSTAYAILDAPWTPIYIFVLFLLHPWLGVMAIIFCLNLTLLAGYSSFKTRNFKDQSTEEEREFNDFVDTKLRNAEVIESLGMSNRLKSIWWLKQQNVLQVGAESDNIESKINSLSKEITILKQSLALGLGAILVMRGELSVGAMIAANLLMTRATAPLDAMVNGWRNFKHSIEAAKRLELLLHDNPDGEHPVKINSLNGAVQLRDVSVKLDGKTAPILDHVSLELNPGETVALVGHSGSGKSTLAKVILGLLPASSGQALVDDVPVQELERTSFGLQVGYLSQNVELFNGTVAENIARMSSVNHAMVIEAAKKVNIHETILRLPGGYDGPILAKSGAFSAGQRQRLALARAVYLGPRLIILDEPDSSLDDQGVIALENLLKELRVQGAAVLLITHRVSLLALATRIVTMKSGKIVSNELSQVAD